MIKVLYAATNTEGSRIQLSRFLEAIKDYQIQLKIAAYKKSSPPNISIDWTLDCLMCLNDPKMFSTTKNENYFIYYDQVKRFNPDVIITDLEYYTSLVAIDLSIPLCQCSPLLLNNGLTNGQKSIGTSIKHRSILNWASINMPDIIRKSNCKLVYSHFGDCDNAPFLSNDCEWIRPYHTIGVETDKHNIVSVILNNKNIYSFMKQNKDCVIFSNDSITHKSLMIKNLNDETYIDTLKSANIFVGEGQTSFLADAYYNGKFAILFPDFTDMECAVNCMFSENLGNGKIFYNTPSKRDIKAMLQQPIVNNYNNVKYLHEKLFELI